MHSEKTTHIRPVPMGRVIDPQRPVIPYWSRVEDASCSESHAHPRGQFVYSVQGITRVVTQRGVYLVPSQQAFWCPPDHEHMLVFPGAVEIANLFIDPLFAQSLPAEQQVYDVSPLLRQLILKAVSIGESYEPQSREDRLMRVILDEIRQLPVSPLSLPGADDTKLQQIMAAILEHPTDNRTIDEWAESVHVSSRTLARLFKSEVNMTFGEWRLQARLFHALERLFAGESVTAVALDVGYSTPSAFIAAFRKALGTSPLEYIRAGKA